MSKQTLRELSGLDQTPGSLVNSTLVFVDYQNTYTRGVMELDGWEPALKSASNLLAMAREAGTKVVHVMHDAGVGSPYDVTADIGKIHASVAPIDGESVVVKQAPNSFIGTNLGELVDQAGNESLIIAGFMTHMCVTFTSAGAFLRGNRPTVIAETCATRPLESAAGKVTSQQLHASALATIADMYGVVVPDVKSLS